MLSVTVLRSRGPPPASPPFTSATACFLLELRVQGRQVPDLHGLIRAARDQEPTIAADRQGADGAPVTAESVEQLEGRRVPRFHCAILRRGGDPSAIGAEGHRRALAAELSPDLVKRLAGLRIPECQLIIATDGNQAPPVRMEGHPPNRGVRSL